MSRVRLRGIEVGYDEAGEGAAVVLLHGYPFNRSLWREQVETLAADHRVIAPDLRGHGETTAGEGPATMDEMAADVAALMDELKIERATLGGLSMGGYVTLAFYRRFPSRVNALVLADTRPQADTEEGRRGREEQPQKILAQGIESIVDRFLEKVLTPATLAGRPEIVARVRRMITSTNRTGAANALRGMALRQDQTDLLPGINIPTLIVVGSEDQLTPPRDAELMHRLIPGSQLERIEGAAHVSNVERPAEFNRALKEFLKVH
jgi:3-oxoadipate enol-lactonase